MKTIQQRELSAEVEVALNTHCTHPVDVYSWLKSLTELQRLMAEESEAEHVINALRAGLIHWIQQVAEEKNQVKTNGETPEVEVLSTDGKVITLASHSAWQRKVD